MISLQLFVLLLPTTLFLTMGPAMAILIKYGVSNAILRKKVMLIVEILVPCRGTFGNTKVQLNKQTHARTQLTT